MPDASRLVIKTARASNTGKHLSFSPWTGRPAYLQLLASLKPSTTRMKNCRPLALLVVSLWIVALEEWLKLWQFQAFWNTTASKKQRGSINNEVGGFVILVLPVRDNYCISVMALALRCFRNQRLLSVRSYGSHWDVTIGQRFGESILMSWAPE